MKTLLFILILIITILSCKTDECKCSVSAKQLEILNNRLDELEEVLGYEWHDKFMDVSDKTYILGIDNLLTTYMKVYKFGDGATGPFLETTLLSKYIENKVTKRLILERKMFNLTNAQWNTIDAEIESKCFWTQPMNFEIDTNVTDFLTYSLEGYNPDKNSCTKNKYHMIKKQSKTHADINRLMQLLCSIEPMDDLDSLNQLSYPLEL